jgi:hypothetical protein
LEFFQLLLIQIFQIGLTDRNVKKEVYETVAFIKEEKPKLQVVNME